MSQGNQTPIDPRGEPRLKLTEPEVSAEQPWNDDVLDRAQIAAKLTNLIRDQSAPLAISIHGYWGTGKTFMLKRWQKDLEIQGFQAIYFNAWEDDFCDDPLLAIIGQLSEYFKEGSLKTFTDKLAKIALPLMKKSIPGIVKMASGGIIEIDLQQPSERNLLKEYLEQRASKDELKKHLRDLAGEVVEKTGHPLVFIIDELDRCRPTFAIELLERVKHIFDVHNMVFVFGLNREELCKSLSSVYGDITTDVYLRRFFDFEFNLPEADSAAFCKHLMETFELSRFFNALGGNPNLTIHRNDFQNIHEYFPTLWGRLGLSLRDIDYCVRLIALIGRSIEIGHNTYPWLLGILIPIKFKKAELYKRLFQGNWRASEVVNCISEMLAVPGPMDSVTFGTLDLIEAYLYHAEYKKSSGSRLRPPTGLDQLELRMKDSDPEHLEYLAERTQHAENHRVSRIRELVAEADRLSSQADPIAYLVGLIDTYQGIVRR